MLIGFGPPLRPLSSLSRAILHSSLLLLRQHPFDRRIPSPNPNRPSGLRPPFVDSSYARSPSSTSLGIDLSLFHTLVLAQKSFPNRVMLRGKNSARETHYEILSARENSTNEEIRTCYRAAILNSHPDKSQTNGSADDAFFKVQKAWEVLGNPTTRALYDNDLRASRRDDMAVSDDVSIGDMMVEDGGDLVELYHQCRCGDYFSVDSSELGKMGYRLLRDSDKMSLQTVNDSPASVVLPCGSCSLRIRVLIDSDVCLSCDVF